MTATLVRGCSGGAHHVLAIVQPIDERIKAEEQLRESEGLFREFAENSVDVLWIIDKRKRKVEYLSRAYEQMWGQAREVVMGDLDTWLELVHPEDRAKIRANKPRLLAGETVVTDYRIIRPNDGAMRWIRDTCFPIRDEDGAFYRVGGVCQDVTEDKNRSEALRESEERFRLLVEGTPDYAMMMVDTSNHIIYWNIGAERVFGWSAEEALGKSGEIIFTPEDRARGREEKEMAIAQKNGFAPDRRWHLCKDGSRIWVDGVMRRLDDENGNVRAFAKIARDATELHLAEEQLHHTHDELEQRVCERTAELTEANMTLQREIEMRARLEREILLISEREKRRIGEDLHDMVCQELTATALLLKSAAKKVSTESAAAAATLEDSAQIVNRNVGIARDLARGLQAIDLSGPGLGNAIRAMAVQACEGHSIDCHFKASRGLRLDDTTALHLYRIVQEAVTNAVRHSGGNKILVTLERHADIVQVLVRDDGKGGTTRQRSKGLGLHMMNYRANVLGGRMTVEKAPGGGTQIRCSIPAKK